MSVKRASTVFHFWLKASNLVKRVFIKALANEDTLLRTYCCRHKCFPVCPRGNICCGHKFCIRDTRNVFDFVQKHFVSATNVSQFVQPKKHHGQQCVRNNGPKVYYEVYHVKFSSYEQLNAKVDREFHLLYTLYSLQNCCKHLLGGLCLLCVYLFPISFLFI